MKREALDAVWSVEAMRQAAARRLPRSVFDAVDGGAGDEITVRENRAAFNRIWLRPRTLADVDTVDTSTTIFGTSLSMPVVLGPCGFVHRLDRGGELAAASAAAAAGTVFVVHNAPAYPIEVLADAAPGRLWGQVYLPSDRAVAQAVLDRLERAGIDVLCVTIDCPVSGNRERNYKNRLTTPQRVTPPLSAMLRAAIGRPRWGIEFLEGRRRTRRLHSADRPPHHDHAHEKSVTASDVEWLRSRWKGPLVLKGVQRGEECEQLAELGVDGVVVSNHGGRHLDTARPSIDVLPEVAGALAGRAAVFLDSGVRRGIDVMKALALGASAVLIGRPYVFGLSVAGEAGVTRVLEIMRSELTQAMALSGCASLRDIDGGIVKATLVSAMPASTRAGDGTEGWKPGDVGSAESGPLAVGPGPRALDRRRG